MQSKMFFKMCEGIPCSSSMLRNLILLFIKNISLYNPIKFLAMLFPNHWRAWWLRRELGIVTRSYRLCKIYYFCFWSNKTFGWWCSGIVPLCILVITQRRARVYFDSDSVITVRQWLEIGMYALVQSKHFDIWVSYQNTMIQVNVSREPWNNGYSKVICISRTSDDSFMHRNIEYNDRTLLSMYRQTFNIRRTKSSNLNVSRHVLLLSLPNPLKSGVKSRVKM